jgi:hypothetical protein
MNVKTIGISLVFILVGVLLLNYALTRPCEVGDITQTIGNTTTTVEQPVKMNRMVCLSSDLGALVTMLLGMAAIFPGVSGLYKGITGGKEE